MAYSARQKTIIAYALALEGGNVAAARRYLADNSMEVPDISESTIRRIMPDLAEQIAEQALVIKEEGSEATRQAERERLKKELHGSFQERLTSMESKALELGDRIGRELDQPGTDPRELIRFYECLQGFILKIRNKGVPVVGEMWQADALIRSYQKVLMKKLGPAVTEGIQKDVSREFQAEMLSHEKQEAEAAQG